jgi:hypothetical protein
VIAEIHRRLTGSGDVTHTTELIDEPPNDS